MPRIWKWLLLSAAIVVIDQITKALVLQGFALHQSVALTPFFNLVLVYNTGAAFSLLSDAPGWQRELFIGIAAVASAWIVYLLAR
jgi:signal peptidase II